MPSHLVSESDYGLCTKGYKAHFSFDIGGNEYLSHPANSIIMGLVPLLSSQLHIKLKLQGAVTQG